MFRGPVRNLHLLRRPVVSAGYSPKGAAWVRNLSLPSHKVVPMPALSPTMETGSIAKWNLNVGDRFEAGSSLCDVETDKATVSFDAQEEGYIAKILISSGDIKVGQPLLITVDEAEDIAAFANFTVDTAAAPAAPVAAPAAAPSSSAPKSTPALTTTSNIHSNSNSSTGRIFASPLAKKLVREAGDDLSRVASVLGGGQNGTGYSGRIVAADVVKALQAPRTAATTTTASPVAEVTTAAAPVKAASKPVSVPQISGVYQDFTVTDEHAALSARLAHSKHSVPHYYLSVELNLQKLLQLRSQLNTLNAPPKGKGDADANSGIAVLDLLVKAAAQTMRTVPDLNAAWMDSFVRQYHQVDINVVMSSQNAVVTPVVRDVAGRGLAAVSTELAAFEGRVAAGESLSEQETAEGTFTVHNLGVYGVRSAAPILLPPQAAALSLGAINDVVVPRTSPAEGEQAWEVAPVMVVTLVCDHRVVDGAVSAQWLSAFKNNVENPVNLLM